MGSSGSFVKLYWKVTKKLRGSGEDFGGGGVGTGGGVSGGAGIFGVAKCAFTWTLVRTSDCVTRAMEVLRASSAYGRRKAASMREP